MLILREGNLLSFLEHTFHLVGVPAAAMFDKPSDVGLLMDTIPYTPCDMYDFLKMKHTG